MVEFTGTNGKFEVVITEDKKKIVVGIITKEFPELPYSFCSGPSYVFSAELDAIITKLKELNENL